MAKSFFMSLLGHARMKNTGLILYSLASAIVCVVIWDSMLFLAYAGEVNAFVLIQIGSKTSEFVWYGRGGLGTWAGCLFFVTCLIGSYATNPDLSPRQMREWLYVYVVFCFLSGWSAGAMSLIHALNFHLHQMADWQSSILTILGTAEFLFCLIEVILVVYRICSAGGVPQGFDFHVTVECATDGTTTTVVRETTGTEVPPPSYEQIYLAEIVATLPRSISGDMYSMTDLRRNNDSRSTSRHSTTGTYVSRVNTEPTSREEGSQGGRS